MIEGDYNDDNNINTCSVGHSFLASAVFLNHRYRDVGAWQREDEQGA